MSEQLCIKDATRPCSDGSPNPWSVNIDVGELADMVDYFYRYKVQ